MPENFLHGPETIRLQNFTASVPQLKSSVILLVGTAQAGPLNTLTLCSSTLDDAKFLPPNGTAELGGFTIPQALRVLRACGAGLVMVVNVWDAGWTDATAAARIIGTTNASGQRSGLALIEDAISLFGFAPKILIAPGFSSLSSVSAALISRAAQNGAVTFVDAPLGTSVTQAIAGRGAGGAINFQTSSPRVVLCYPHVRAFDKVANAVINMPMSQFAAGAMAAKDVAKGVGYSVSNTELLGVIGLERPITFRMDDPNCEANLLNGAGITTVANGFGTGFRLWGNRAANFPVVNGLETFVSCTRLQDMLDEAIRTYAFAHIDEPVSQALIDHIVEQVNRYINGKVNQGEYIGGRCWFDPAKNTPDQLGNGWAKFSYEFTPAPPMERMTFESRLTNDYLVTVK